MARRNWSVNGIMTTMSCEARVPQSPRGQGEQPLSLCDCSICDFCNYISVATDLLEGIQAESDITATVHWMDEIMPFTGDKSALEEHPAAQGGCNSVELDDNCNEVGPEQLSG